MKVICYGGVDIAYDHEPKRDSEAPREGIDRDHVQYDDENPIGHRLRERAFPVLLALLTRHVPQPAVP